MSIAKSLFDHFLKIEDFQRMAEFSTQEQTRRSNFMKAAARAKMQMGASKTKDPECARRPLFLSDAQRSLFVAEHAQSRQLCFSMAPRS